jgi:hypothetical protein
MLYKLQGQVGDSAQPITFREDDKITRIDWCFAGGTISDGDATDVSAEISFLQNESFGAPDTVGVLMLKRFHFKGLSGKDIPSHNESGVVPFDHIPVASGERLYLHLTDSNDTSAGSWFTCYIHTEKGEPNTRAVRRR